jgi:hypothetical protein
LWGERDPALNALTANLIQHNVLGYAHEQALKLALHHLKLKLSLAFEQALLEAKELVGVGEELRLGLLRRLAALCPAEVETLKGGEV